ncbi:hypothetical protein BJ912DRAFT_130761 [Pholiota molesta]|nr:hypothetical protein BJ912DRAFT_130761 [Pholiota molesta]
MWHYGCRSRHWGFIRCSPLHWLELHLSVPFRGSHLACFFGHYYGCSGVMALTAAASYPIKTDDDDLPAGGLDIFFAVLASLSFGIGILGVLPYIIARLLLLVEAFISLRQLPPSALLAVRWTAFLPHV